MDGGRRRHFVAMNSFRQGRFEIATNTRSSRSFSSRQEKTRMKFRTIALATALAVSSSMAFAQAGGYDSGATVPERSGTAVDGNGVVVAPADRGRIVEPGTTVGASPAAPSGPRSEPGGRDESRPGGRGVNDKPPGN
jgi:hypothetical protein